jgi:small neutral amino acid transporter SnatA (MarC family)
VVYAAPLIAVPGATACYASRRSSSSEDRLSTKWVLAQKRFARSVTLAIAFLFALPLNRWLIARGRGHAVVDEYH